MGKTSNGFDVPDTTTTSDYNFTEITENSQVEEPYFIIYFENMQMENLSAIQPIKQTLFI